MRWLAYVPCVYDLHNKYNIMTQYSVENYRAYFYLVVLSLSFIIKLTIVETIHISFSITVVNFSRTQNNNLQAVPLL